jgi:hypothetical protein
MLANRTPGQRIAVSACAYDVIFIERHPGDWTLVAFQTLKNEK